MKKVKILDCFINLSKDDETTSKKELIENLSNEIKEMAAQQKEKYFKFVDDEFCHINENFRTISNEDLKRFYEKYSTKISNYRKYDRKKFWIIHILSRYLNDHDNVMTKYLISDDDFADINKNFRKLERKYLESFYENFVNVISNVKERTNYWIWWHLGAYLFWNDNDYDNELFTNEESD